LVVDLVEEEEEGVDLAVVAAAALAGEAVVGLDTTKLHVAWGLVLRMKQNNHILKSCISIIRI
jgi:hypothetical protein